MHLARNLSRRTLALALVALAWAALVPAVGAAAPGGKGKARSASVVSGSFIVVFRGSVDAPAEKTDRLERSRGFKSRLRYGKAVKGFAARLSQRQVDELRADPEVAFVAPDRPVKALGAVPLTSGDTAPSGVRRVEAASATSAREASAANVAVIDTGIDLGNSDLNAVDGKNCVGSGPTQDDEGHGTHVAGSIAAKNNGAGVVGVAPGTRTYGVKVLDSTGGGTYSQIICGIDWVTSTRTDADPANDIAVANLSLGGVGAPVQPCSTTTDPMHKAVCSSTSAGVTYVVAAGNDGWDFDYASAPDTPAAYPEVLTVSAMSDSDGKGGATGGAPSCSGTDADDRYASFSNFAATAAGSAHTVAGPGVCIASTRLGGGQAVMSGTSMATPHLAGAVALCLSEGGQSGPCAGLKPAEIVNKVRSDAQGRTTNMPSYGFAGDPTRPMSGAYFGYLWWAGGASPRDTVAPSVASVAPAAGATAVPTSPAVSVTFSEPMDAAAAQSAFSLIRYSNGARVAGSFSWSGNTMTFRPSAALAGGTSYLAKVSPAAKDVSGNALPAEKAWSFKTITTVNASPVAAGVESGSLRSGTYSRLAGDDNVFYDVNSTTSGTRVSAWQGRFAGVTNDVRSIRVNYRGRNSVTCAQTVFAYRWTTNSWVALDSRNVGTTEVLIDRTVSGAPADYVSGTSGDGDVYLRVRCTHGTASFYSSGDQLRLIYTKP